jgi:type II secretory ATPase GspE/PulE/Tfp pilus assembly ATPase PilB-like protein
LFQYHNGLKKQFADFSHNSQDVDLLLHHALLQKSSTIFVEKFEDETLVRFRINGKLYDAFSLNAEKGEILFDELKQRFQFSKKEIFQSVRYKEKNHNLRVSFFKKYSGESVMIQFLGGYDIFDKPLIDDGIIEQNLEKLREVLQLKNGLVLLGGRDEKQRLETLSAIIKSVSDLTANISFVGKNTVVGLKFVSQIKVDIAKDFDYSKAVRFALRNEPDVLIVDEITNIDVANLLVMAVISGKKVFTSVKAKNLISTIEKIGELVPTEYLTNVLSAVIFQDSVKKLNPLQAKAYKLSSSAVANLNKKVNLEKILRHLKSDSKIPKNTSWTDISFFKTGVEKKISESYSGDLKLFEILKVDHQLLTILSQEKKIKDKKALFGLFAKSKIDYSKMEKDFEKYFATNADFRIVEDAVLKAVIGQTTLEEVFNLIEKRS